MYKALLHHSLCTSFRGYWRRRWVSSFTQLHNSFNVTSLLLLTLALTLEPTGEFFAVCISSTLEITCTSNASSLAWNITSNQESSKNTDSFHQYTSMAKIGVVGMIGDFVVRLQSKNPLASTATLDDVRLKHNWTFLQCMDDLLYYLASEIAQITILVKGKLHVIHTLLSCWKKSITV